MLNVRDKSFRFLIILLPLVLVMYINGTMAGVTTEKVFRTVISFCAIVLVCEGSRYLIYRSHRWFPGKFRMLLVFIIGVLYTTLILATSTVLRTYIGTGVWNLGTMVDSNIIINDKALVIGLFGYSLINALVNFTIVLIGYEIIYRQAQLRHAREEKDRLEKEKLKAELLQLKGIVNPHFLFNNLNSLSSLISENPEQAQNFLDELTKVFRYLLRNNQTELTTLDEELKFIQTYYQLLQTRYGEGIHLVMKVNETDGQLMLPPLTLQLLVENAVKHNRIQKGNPLQIELQSAGDKKLFVRNTVYKKEGMVESTGIGLQTINARYRMLNQPPVIIERSEDHFTVIIQLI